MPFVDTRPQTPPPPPPPPPPSEFSIDAPARATVGSGTAPVLASSATPNFSTGPAGTRFPMLQTTMVYDPLGARPDSAVNSAGGSAIVNGSLVDIDVDAFQSASVAGSWTGHSNLDWTRVGYWATGGGWWDYDDEVGRRSAFVFGYETPAAAMPASGTATYAGTAEGAVFSPGTGSGSTHCACVIYEVSGDASFTADFGARTLSGSLTNMSVPIGWDFESRAWNDVDFTAAIAGNGFSGSTRVTNAPAESMGANAAGTLEGKFFGPSAQEAGAVWTLHDGTNSAMGTLSGKRD